MTSQLGERAVRGTLWLGLVNLVSKGSQIVVTLVLAAFMTESEFGAVALTVALVNIGQVIHSMGVYDVISRTDSDPHRAAGTVLTLSVVAGGLLAVVLVLAAEPIAVLLGSPQAATLVRLAALSLPFTAMGGVQMGLLHRHLDFRRRMLPDAGSAVLGAAVTVALATHGAGPIALVVGLLCTAVGQPLLGVLVGVRLRPTWDPAIVTQTLRWVAVVGPAAVVVVLQVNVDYFAIGHVLGPGAVGVYSLAYRIAWVPYIMVAIVLGAVAFPVCTRLLRARRHAELGLVAGRLTRATVVITGGLYLITALLADRLVLLGTRWATAAAVLVPLCAYGLAISVLHIWYQVIKAAGHGGRYLAVEVVHLGMLVATLVLVTRHGIVAVAVTQAVVAWLLVGLTWWTLARLRLTFPPAELARMAGGVLGAAAGCAAAALVLDWLVRLPHAILDLLVEGLVLVFGYAGGTLLTQRGAVRELRALLSRRPPAGARP